MLRANQIAGITSDFIIDYKKNCKSNKSHWNGRGQTVSNVARENSQHFPTSLLVSREMTSERLQNWWCITTQIWVMLLIGWINLLHRLLSRFFLREGGSLYTGYPIRSNSQIWVVTHHWYGISALFSHTSGCRGNQLWCCKMPAVFSAYFKCRICKEINNMHIFIYMGWEVKWATVVLCR